MYVSLGSVSVSPVMKMQTTLRDLGYLKPSEVDGLFGKITMTAVLRLGFDSVTDFAASLNAAGGSADARQIGIGAMRGVQNKLESAIGPDGWYARTDAAFAAVQEGQQKLKTEWERWVRTGGRPMTPRALAFTSMVISKSTSSGAPSAPSAPSVSSSMTPPGAAPPGGAPEAPPEEFTIEPWMVLVGAGVAVLALYPMFVKKG